MKRSCAPFSKYGRGVFVEGIGFSGKVVGNRLEQAVFTGSVECLEFYEVQNVLIVLTFVVSPPRTLPFRHKPSRPRVNLEPQVPHLSLPSFLQVHESFAVGFYNYI